MSAWRCGDASDPVLRRSCAAGLARLRDLWRSDASLFSADAIAELQALAAELRRPARQGTDTPQGVLEKVFGYPSFRPGQAEIIEAVLAGRDCVGVMPTGAGKSITFQIPARLLGGTALVVSPLIALMKDQVDAMQEVGIRATFLNSSLEPEERRERVEALRRGEYELVYAAPEGLEASVGWVLGSLKLSMIAIDEAHCISQWGHDFRPAYRNLAGLKERFGGVPVLALTATATREVTGDIVAQLGMREPLEVRGSFFRPNLRLHAFKKGEGGVPQIREALLRLVLERTGQSGIIYCLSRKTAESTAEFLRDQGVRALPYHAGLDSETRSRTQEAFRRDDVDVVVATIAFGMGIDKSNVRFVFHRDMPRSLEGYYQEIGRAGRDGAPSDCVLFYSWADVMSYDRFAEQGDGEVAKWHRRRVREMYRFADRKGCRHQALVGYLGEPLEPCGSSCDACSGSDLIAQAPAPVRKRGKKALAAEERPRPVAQSPDGELFLQLKALRRRIADARGVPAYMVFTDATLLEMTARRPTTPDELLLVSGVGPARLARYGAEFLAALKGR
jgi:ATP-dependent DNA helicase RecQ